MYYIILLVIAMVNNYVYALVVSSTIYPHTEGQVNFAAIAFSNVQKRFDFVWLVLFVNKLTDQLMKITLHAVPVRGFSQQLDLLSQVYKRTKLIGEFIYK